MKKLIGVIFVFMVVASASNSQPIAAKSSVTVLVDLSKSWFNPASEASNRRALNAVAETVGGILPKLKSPVNIRYLEISQNSMSQKPICEVRYFPNIFRKSRAKGEYADIPSTMKILQEMCPKSIFMHKPAELTDITGALNTVARVLQNEAPEYSAVIILSDFREERSKGSTGTIGNLTGVRSLLLYRVLNSDRQSPDSLFQRIDKWKGALRAAGAATTDAVDDVIVDTGTMTRLLLR